MLPIASECVSNASRWVPMDANGSERVRKLRETRENFEKPRENFEKLRENFERLRKKNRKNFFHGVVGTVSWESDTVKVNASR